jgi:hypothetical protein
MKTNDLLLLAGLAGLAYYFKKDKSSSDTSIEGSGVSSAPVSWQNPIEAGTTTPSGNTITETITSPKQGVQYINNKYTNAQNRIAVSYDNVPVNLPGNASLPGNLRTTINKNQLLQKRSGGGYKVVGARNITLYD